MFSFQGSKFITPLAFEILEFTKILSRRTFLWLCSRCQKPFKCTGYIPNKIFLSEFCVPLREFQTKCFFYVVANNLTIYSCETNLLFLNSGVDKTSGSAIKHTLERPLVDKNPISIRIISQYNISKNAEQLSYFVIKWGKGVSSGF
jgi:hypothetical protein